MTHITCFREIHSWQVKMRWNCLWISLLQKQTMDWICQTTVSLSQMFRTSDHFCQKSLRGDSEYMTEREATQMWDLNRAEVFHVFLQEKRLQGWGLYSLWTYPGTGSIWSSRFYILKKSFFPQQQVCGRVTIRVVSFSGQYSNSDLLFRTN